MMLAAKNSNLFWYFTWLFLTKSSIFYEMKAQISSTDKIHDKI